MNLLPRAPLLGELSSASETERFNNRRGYFFYFLSLLSLLVAHAVPTVWNT